MNLQYFFSPRIPCKMIAAISTPTPSLEEDHSPHQSFPGGSEGKELACNTGDQVSNPGLGRSPGEGMAIYSSILVWRIPWTEEPGGQFMGLQRIGHN